MKRIPQQALESWERRADYIPVITTFS